MSNALESKLSRMREAAINLNRVGGVGPTAVNWQHTEFVLKAQAAAIEELATIVATLSPKQTFVDTSGNGITEIISDGKTIDRFETKGGVDVKINADARDARHESKGRKLASAK